MHNFVEVSCHNLESSQTWGFRYVQEFGLYWTLCQSAHVFCGRRHEVKTEEESIPEVVIKIVMCDTGRGLGTELTPLDLSISCLFSMFNPFVAHHPWAPVLPFIGHCHLGPRIPEHLVQPDRSPYKFIIQLRRIRPQELGKYFLVTECHFLYLFFF
jgi:hypothetical protein